MDESWRPVLQLFKIRGMGAESLQLLGIGFLAGLLLLSALFYCHRWIQELRARKKDWRWFRRMIAMKQLSPGHVALLTGMARQQRLKRVTPLLTSIRTFDTTIENFLANGQFSGSEHTGLVESLQELRQALHFTHTGLGKRLHSTRTIGRGQSVGVRLHVGERERLLRGMITGVDDNGMIIELQGRFAAAGALAEGQMVMLAFLRAGDAEYHCETNIQTIVSRDPTVLRAAHSSRLFRRQRRTFFRIPVKLDALIWILTEQQQEEFNTTGRTHVPAEAVPLHGRTVSLSGSGAALMLPHPVALRTYLSATLILSPELHLYNVTCRVVRVARIREMLYRVYVQFLDLGHPDRERIVRFVIQEERVRLAALLERNEGKDTQRNPRKPLNNSKSADTPPSGGES